MYHLGPVLLELNACHPFRRLLEERAASLGFSATQKCRFQHEGTVDELHHASVSFAQAYGYPLCDLVLANLWIRMLRVTNL